jgi:DNA-binding transcriptional MerR regulator
MSERDDPGGSRVRAAARTGSDVAARRAHLSIGEVLSLLQEEFPDITISKIRFLESQGLLDPERTPSGYRKFYDDDIARLRWILAQQRDNFLPLKVIKERLAQAETAADLDAGGEADAGDDRGGQGADELANDDRRGSTAGGGGEPDRAALAAVLERRAAERAGVPPAAGLAPRSRPEGGGTLDAGPSEVSLTRAELAAAADLAEADVEALESFGLLTGRPLGGDVVYDGDALVVARLAAAFRAHGLEARHLRMFKIAADREANVFEQLVTPIVRQRNAESRRRATDRLEELAGLGHDLHDALLRQALRAVIGG